MTLAALTPLVTWWPLFFGLLVLIVKVVCPRVVRRQTADWPAPEFGNWPAPILRHRAPGPNWYPEHLDSPAVVWVCWG